MSSVIAPLPENAEAPVAPARWTRSALLLIGLGIMVGVMIVASLLSLRFGSLEISSQQARDAVFSYDDAVYEQVIVRELRVPRTLIALAVGGSLGIAGTVMQGVTRNPLAGPSILGVSAGASFGVTLAIYVLGVSTPSQFVWFAFPGAALAAIVVFGVASSGRGGATPVRLALAGVVVSALLASWTSALLLLSEETMDLVRFWSVGSVAGRPLDVLWGVLPLMLPAAIACLFLGQQLNVLSMGEESARGLGMNTTRVRLVASALVVVLTGSAVSVAGPIGFVGLATPHIARSLVGSDYRWVLPYSFLLGSILLVLADTTGRVAARPSEIQVGVVMAFIGAPFLIALARRRSVAN